MADLSNPPLLAPRRSVLSPGDTAFPVRHAALRIEEAVPVGIVRIQWRADDALFVRSLESRLALALPSAGRHVGDAGRELAWAGPGECVLLCAVDEEDHWAVALGALEARQVVAATVISDSRVGFDITGSDAREFLSKGCSLDLHPSAFATGDLALTRFAGQPALLMCRGADLFRIFFDAPFAAYIRCWIVDAAKEFGGAP